MQKIVNTKSDHKETRHTKANSTASFTATPDIASPPSGFVHDDKSMTTQTSKKLIFVSGDSNIAHD